MDGFLNENIGLIVCLMTGFAFFYFAVIFMKQLQDVSSDFREQQLKTGDTTLNELYINLSPQVLLMLRLMIAISVFIVIFLAIASILFSAIAAIFAFMVPAWYLGALKKKRVKLVEAQLVDGLELLGNTLKSGLTLPQAVELLVREMPPPLSQEFALVLAENRLGVDFNDALQNMADRLQSNILQILASGVSVTKRCGGDLTVIFQNIAQTIREQATIEGKLDAVTAQGRFQGKVLGFMPFALVGILYFIDRNHVETLFGYQIGLFAMFLVICMVAMAQFWIHKMLQIDV